MDIYFETTIPYYGTTKVYPLVPNGSNVQVTNENFNTYLEKYAEFYCSKSITRQFNAFKAGFDRVVTSPLIKE